MERAIIISKEQLKIILTSLRKVVVQHKANRVAVEKVFGNVKRQSTLLLAQARGAAICAAVQADLPVAEYTTLQVKQAVVGKGHANKGQVQAMAQRLLKLSGTPSPYAADALVCAICHAHGGMGLGALATRGFRVRGGRLV